MRLHSGDLHLRFASMNTVFCPTGYFLVSGEIIFFDDVSICACDACSASAARLLL